MSSPQHEPTMEEILASIRKIISEDAPEGALELEAHHLKKVGIGSIKAVEQDDA